jgi:phosphate acetyltransferase
MSLPASAIAFMASAEERLRRARPKKRIVFPEIEDPRIQVAVERLAASGAIEPILLKPEGVAIDRYASIYYERRRAKGITQMEAAAVARNPLYLAPLMVAAGDADGCVSGAIYSTADVARAALQTIGTPPALRTASSFFLMCLFNENVGHRGQLMMADCGVVIDPTAIQLADIAISTAASTRALLGVEPAVALLSFSTKGSARHKEVAKVVEALRIVRERAPELHVDGELQLDAAIVREIGESKAPGSTVAGHANTLIFPNIAAGNIGYKLLECMCGAAAYGPILQGLAKPANDLSRGCSSDDVYSVALITALQSMSNATSV